MSPVTRLVLAAVMLLGLALPATAIETGTRAWLIRGQLVYDTYARLDNPVGELEGQIRIRVDRCYILWCLIHAHGVHGWVSKHNISFGREPKYPIWPRFY